MAAEYPTNFYDERQQPHIVHVNPYDEDDYDRERTPERLNSTMQRTAEYVSGINPNVDSYPIDNYYHHRHDSQGLPPLTIRRHTPGSNDPSLQKFPINLQSSSENISSSSNVHVTIKRNPISSDQPTIPPVIQPVIQPVYYPVAVYVNSPVPQYPVNQPVEQIPPKKELTKPKSPVKASPTPPISPKQFETESFRSSESRNKNMNTSPRRPIRLDLITPSPPTLEPRRVRSSQVIVEEFDDYDEYYRVPSVYSVPQKVISYRTAAPGMTTRELENAQMDHSGQPIYVESPPLQTITYRAS